VSKSRNLLALLTGTVLLGAAAFPAMASRPSHYSTLPPDNALYTTYEFYNNFANILFLVCGSTVGTSGCYGSGQLGPFGHVGAIIEGNETIDVQTQTVTRKIYVVDQSVGGGTGTKLFIYTKKDVIGTTDDAVGVTLTDSVNLPLVGGANVRTFLAANRTSVYIGTSQTPFPVAVDKSTLAVTQLPSSSSNVSSITANKYGYVTVSAGEMFVYGPTGALEESGGGSYIMANTILGTTTFDLPATPAASMTRNRGRFRGK
jgi:hypothetical protein